MDCKLIEQHTCFNGEQRVYSHFSNATNSEMRFAIYLPLVNKNKLLPVLYWLSGLTCSEQNFITKGFAQQIASELGVVIVTPDTSPRGVSNSHDTQLENIGEGASFYLDATEEPWAHHYRMYTYICDELPALISRYFPVDNKRQGIFGHSMGGHGALSIAIKNNHLYKSVSAFAPIVAPMLTPWGQNAFLNYVGSDESLWQQYDACHLMATYGWPHGEILIDQGGQDPFLNTQLKPELFANACLQANVPLNLRIQEPFDHSYYFVASFIKDHVQFHAKNLTS